MGRYHEGFPENGIEFLQDGYIIKANEVLFYEEP